MRTGKGFRVAGGIAVMAALVGSMGAIPARSAGFGRPIEAAAAAMGIPEDVPDLKAGRAVARQLETDNDAQLCAAGSVVVDAPLDALAAGFRDLSLLEASGTIAASRRISDKLSVEDFAALPIPDSDLEGLRAAKRGGSDVKLSAKEIEEVRAAGPEGAAEVFKRVLLRRVLAWRESGSAGLGTYADKRTTVDQAAVTKALLAGLGRTCPRGAFEPVESFQYWSVERFGSLKPFVALTNMTIRRGAGTVRIETVQLYASHYCEGLVASVDLHALPGGERGPQTLVRLTFRTQVDALGGVLGAIKRKVGRSKMVEQLAGGLERLRAEAPRVAQLARRG